MTRVLIVEDNWLVANDLEGRLSELGYATAGIVQSGSQCLEKSAESQPDLILMDINLKGEMDGIEAALRIEGRYRIPVIFTTAQDSDDIIRRAQLSNPYGYILKPYTNAALDATIQTALNVHKLYTDKTMQFLRLETLRRQQALLVEILTILNDPVSPLEGIHKILSAIKQETRFEAVGIRLKKDDEFPFFAQEGYSADFIEAENSLRGRADDGTGILEGICGLVLTGRTDARNPLFTRGGSAWTNDASLLPPPPTESDPCIHTRNRCILEGYRSLAVIPIRAQHEIIGTLQINDREKDRLNPELIDFLEQLGTSIGVAVTRLMTEENLQKSEEKFRALIEQSREGIVITDEKGIIDVWNTSMETLTGLPQGQARGIPVWEIRQRLLPSSAQTEKTAASLKKAVLDLLGSAADSQAKTSILEIQDLRGTVKTVHDISWIITTGTSRRYCSIQRDITAVTQTEKTILRENQLLKAFTSMYEPMMKAAVSVTEVADLALKWAKILSGSGEGFITLSERNNGNRITVTGETGIADALPECISDKGILSVPIKLGNETVGQLTLANPREPYTDEIRQSIHRLANQFAIAIQRKRDEEVLEKSEKRFKEVLENINEYVYSVDYEHGGIGTRFHSVKSRNITGYDPEDFEKDPYLWINMVHPEDRPRLLDYINGVQAHQGLPPLEHRIRRKDGRLSWVLNNYTVNFDKKGNMRGAQGFIIDITERVLKEERDREALKTAQTANRAKSEFLASMSHELRTPLNSIIGFSQMLEMSECGTLSEKQRQYVRNIRTSSDYLLKMISDTLDLAKIEAGKIELEKKDFAVAPMLRDLADMMMPVAANKGVILKLDLAGDLGFLHADETRVRQILFNLLSNSLKFTERGKKIYLEGRTDNDQLVITVRDEGIGIPKADQARVFGAYEQVHGNGIARQGSGLGLYITKRLVDMHGGRITLESGSGKGSAFTVTLPGWTSGGSADLTPPETEIRDAQAQYGESNVCGRVLIVEDSILNQELMKSLLEVFGCDYSVAETGLQAVEKAAEKRFDLILMDIDLPDIDGMEASRRIKAASASPVPIIAMTAHVMQGDAERFVEAGMDGVLAKPFEIDRLALILRQYAPAQRTGRVEAGYNYGEVAENMGITEERLGELLHLFFDGLALEYSSNLKNAITKGDFTAIRSCAHKLRGVSLNLRFDTCSRLLSDIEQGAKERVNIDYSALFDQVQTEINTLRLTVLPGAAFGRN